jgi:hypothetical protein
MLSIILVLLGLSYVAVNLVLFGSALTFMTLKEASVYLLFGTLILIKEFILDPWKK